MKFEFWTVAYRKRQGDSTLLNDTATPFRVIPNNWRYWYADPHLFCHGGNTYVFAEAYDRVLRQGVISCCRITENGTTPWKVVLKQPYHLSYPHILQKDGQIYMIPESYVADEIAVFRAKNFPEQWEKVAVLKKGGEPLDSTVFTCNGTRYLMTMVTENEKSCLMRYSLADDGTMGEGLCIAQDDPNSRPAGHLFRVGDQLIRPAQDCTESYGCALNFYEVTAAEESRYEEKLIRKIVPGELCSDWKLGHEGLHTYNMTKDYEIIDLKNYETDPLFWIMRPVWFIWRRIRKVFGK